MKGNPVEDLTEYELRHLAEHLEGSGRVEELHHLLQLEWAHDEDTRRTVRGAVETPHTHRGLRGWLDRPLCRGRVNPQAETEPRVRRHCENAWYATKEAIGDIADYIADLGRAWRLAEKQCASRLCPLAVGLQCSYALINASVNSMATKVPPHLLLALVQKEVWTPTQASFYVQHMSNRHNQQIEALLELIPHVAEGERLFLLQGAVDTAQAIDDDIYRGMALKALVPHLPEPLLYTALTIARAIPRDWSRASALQHLALHLPEPVKNDVLGEALAAVAAATASGEDASLLLANLAPHLPEPLLLEALAAAWRIRPNSRGLALKGLVPPLAKMGHFADAFRAAQAIDNSHWRAQALTRLAPHLREPSQERALREALGAIRAIVASGGRGVDVLLVGLAPHLSEPILRTALALASRIRDHREQARAQAALLLQLARLGHTKEALSAARKYRARAVLAPLLADLGQTEDALTVARSIHVDDDRARALTELAIRLPEPSRNAVLHEALRAARAITATHSRADALERLVPHLPGMLRDKVLPEALESLTPHWRLERLTRLAPYLPKPLLREAFEEARSVGDTSSRARILKQLIPHLPQPLLREELVFVRSIRDIGDLTATQATLVTQMARLGHPEQALAMARTIGAESDQARALIGLAPHLPKASLVEALATARTIEGDYDRARALAALIPRLSKTLRKDVVREALAAAQVTKEEPLRAWVLEMLAPHLSLLSLRKALGATRGLKENRWRGLVLRKLASQFAELGRLRQALAIARDIQDDHYRKRALAELLPHFAKAKRPEKALAVAQAIPDDEYRRQALTGLVSQLAELERCEKALAVARATEGDYARARTLAALAPKMPRSQRKQVAQEALVAARGIRDRYRRREAITRLAPQLRGAERELALEEALAAARAIEDDPDRARALAALAPHLSEQVRDDVLEEALLATQARKDASKQTPVTAQGINLELPRVLALTELVPLLPEPLLCEALAAARAIQNHFDRARALSELARYFPASSQNDVFHEALIATEAIASVSVRADAQHELILRMAEAGHLQQALTVACEIGHDYQREQSLRKLAPHLAEHAPTAVLHSFWCTTLHTGASRTRQALLSDLRALVPVIAVLGGSEAIAETFRAIQDVGRWWP